MGPLADAGEAWPGVRRDHAVVDARMKVLVTGGAGFIGSRLVGALLGHGWQGVVLDDLSSGRRDAVPTGTEIVVQDVADGATVEVIADVRPDVVIHAAAQVSVPKSMEAPWDDQRVNVLGTQHVIRGCQLAQDARLVFVSSGGAIYGETTGATEETSPAPMSYYAVHKYVGERYVELSGLPYAIARPSNVYGPGQRAGLEGAVVAVFADALRTGQGVTIHGSGEQTRDFVHVDDVVSALIAMADSKEDGTWNIATGVAVTINELLKTMVEVFGVTVPVTRTDTRAGDVRNSCLLADHIARDLGWRASITLREGIGTLRAEAGSAG